MIRVTQRLKQGTSQLENTFPDIFRLYLHFSWFVYATAASYQHQKLEVISHIGELSN